MMKTLLLTLMLLPMLAFSTETMKVETNLENQLRAEKAKVEMLVQELRKLKQQKSISIMKSLDIKHRNNCDDDDQDDPVSCTPNCAVRGSSGSCLSYGSDYCGPDASCAMNCAVRGSSGSCLSYNADYCGPSAYCSPNCVVRGSSGSCLSYGSDICY